MGVRVVAGVPVLCMTYGSIRRDVHGSVSCGVVGLMKRSGVGRYRCHFGVRRCGVKHDTSLDFDGLLKARSGTENPLLTC